MFGRDNRLPIDVLLGGEDSSMAEDACVPQHHRRLREAFERASTQMLDHSDQRKVLHDQRARELPLAAGERVYLRNHGVRGRNKIQDAWKATPYRVVSRQGANDVYVVEPADGCGEPRTVNRANLRLCVRGNDNAVAPTVRHRNCRVCRVLYQSLRVTHRAPHCCTQCSPNTTEADRRLPPRPVTTMQRSWTSTLHFMMRFLHFLPRHAHLARLSSHQWVQSNMLMFATINSDVWR